MTYIWIPAMPIIVQITGKALSAFEWRGTHYQVQLIADQWRVDVEWWRVRVWRDYYRVVTQNGYLIVLYQDLLEDSWYLQQLYD